MNYEQLDLFTEKQPLKLRKPIRLVELFAGIGAQASALERMGIPFEHYRICEFDKFAVKSYNAIHGTHFQTSDITKITAGDLGITETNKYDYIMTYSFPCQDISLAGNQKGFHKGEGTRSGLLWEVERLLGEMKERPQVLIMENVSQVHSKKNINDFKLWINKLSEFGYESVWFDLNAVDFGVPQNRLRTFMVSYLGDYKYSVPEGYELKQCMADRLEETAEERYFLDDALVDELVAQMNSPLTI